MKYSNFPQVKITTKDGHTDMFIDGFKIPCITGIKAEWDNCGWVANVNVSMLANIEMEADSKVELEIEEIHKKVEKRI